MNNVTKKIFVSGDDHCSLACMPTFTITIYATLLKNKTKNALWFSLFSLSKNLTTNEEAETSTGKLKTQIHLYSEYRDSCHGQKLDHSAWGIKTL